MKNLLLALLLVCPLLSLAHGQDFVYNANFVYPRTDKGMALPPNTTFTHWQLVWSTNVPIAKCAGSGCAGGSCNISVDTSQDGVTWVSGALFGPDCTLPFLSSTGVKGPLYAVTGGYIRISVPNLTSSTGGPASINVSLRGWSDAY
jgi:hypothetical protein